MGATFKIPAPVLMALLQAASHVGLSPTEIGKNDELRSWNVSGSELIGALEGKSGSGVWDGEAERTVSAARANAYIAGVADATSATLWCGAGSVLPHELAERVYAYLRSVPSERLNGRASGLVGEALAANFPCPDGE